MAKKPIGFTEEGVRRIVRVVRRVERGDDGGGGGDWYPYRGEEGAEPTLCQTTAVWTKGSVATLKILEGQPGTETDTGKTLTAYNRYATIQANMYCTVAMHRGGHWYVIAAECS